MDKDIVADRLLTREELARELIAAGYRSTTSTLATFAARRAGPPFTLYGRTPMYERGLAMKWAEDRSRADIKSIFDAAGR